MKLFIKSYKIYITIVTIFIKLFANTFILFLYDIFFVKNKLYLNKFDLINKFDDIYNFSSKYFKFFDE